jgi:hypothetical protein
MTQRRKYLGMKVTQLGILASLAGVACLLFGLTGWLVLGGGLSVARPPTPTPVIVSTPTRSVLPTLTLTPTPTSIPYEQLIPSGWVQFKTGLIEIWLPSDFTLGDPKLLSNPANLAIPELAITGATSNTSLYQMLVMVSYEPLTAVSLDDFLDGELTRLPTEIRMTERRKVSVNSMDAVRFVFETRSNNIDINDLAYVFLDGSTVWYVEYAAQINEFYEMLPTFEQSMKTFRIVR